ncbi:hypothetical protein ACKI1I_44410 [Streptomyces turgidiscabies]|uniref:Uncharacterized protein n=1 Tax=Streptomyces turgidiscabies (strain Car8) TaxID=698760 RepID=L7F5J3_STRT8|nr:MULTISPECIES: hypothetical protein [Streptomyces]ELP66404.1 hypothetical protein STRTUCAR8_00146 [Streptomyces turgidiscabies Car8]MDX3498099.1 hypothetical protein [Streptomyces turgidiscabies]GAQ76670.1 hypothetical protein T45_08472 [Streptomyces turgidiscabies]
MKEFIKRRAAVEIRVAFGGIYGLALVFGCFPPAYLWASGSAVVIAGLPVAIWYWILIAVLVGLSLWALYWVEDVRGELDEARRPDTSADSAVTSPATPVEEVD